MNSCSFSRGAIASPGLQSTGRLDKGKPILRREKGSAHCQMSGCSLRAFRFGSGLQHPLLQLRQILFTMLARMAFSTGMSYRKLRGITQTS